MCECESVCVFSVCMCESVCVFSVCMCEWESEYVSVSPNVCFRSVY